MRFLLIFVFLLCVTSCSSPSSSLHSPIGSWVDKQTILTVSSKGLIQTWNQTGDVLSSFLMDVENIIDIQILPDSHHFLVHSKDNLVVTNEQGQVVSLPIPWQKEAPAPVGAVYLFSNHVILVTQENLLQEWDQGKQIRSVSLPSKTPGLTLKQAMFSVNGEYLITLAAEDTVVRVFGVLANEFLVSLGGFQAHTSAIQSIFLSPSGKTVFSGDQSGTIIKWDLSKLPQSPTPFLVGVQQESVSFLAASIDGKKLAVGSPSGQICIFQQLPSAPNQIALPKYVLWRVEQGHTKDIQFLQFSSFGDQLLSASMDQTIRLWDTSPDQVTTWPFPVSDIQFSPDQLHFATVNSNIFIWDVDDFRNQPTVIPRPVSVITPTIDAYFESVRFSPKKGDFVLGTKVGAQTEVISTQFITNPTKLGFLEERYFAAGGRSSVEEPVFFSPDGRFVLGNYTDQLTPNCKSILVWELSSFPNPPTQNHFVPLPYATFSCAHPGRTLNLAFHPDGKTVETVGFSGPAKLWDVSDLQSPFLLSSMSSPSLQELGVGTDMQKPNFSFTAFLPDGKTLLLVTNFYRILEYWDIQDQKNPKLIDFVHVVNTSTDIGFSKILLSPDQNTLLLVDGTAKNVSLFDLSTKKVKASLVSSLLINQTMTDRRSPFSAAFSAQGNEAAVLFSSPDESSLSCQLWRIPILKELLVLSKNQISAE